MRSTALLTLIGISLSLPASADDWIWMHVEDSKGQLLFGTSDGQGPAVHTFETSPNTPKFQIQL